MASIAKPESTEQLLEKIKDRDQKIERYEKRLTDVVVAFKNLQKEKTALEETLRQVNFSSKSSKKLRSPVSSAVASETEEDAGGVEGNADSSSSAEVVAEAYEARIGKLLESVNALSQQKNEMQASYQADKRKLREEYEQTISDLKRDLHSCGIVRRDLEGQLSELRARQRQQQKVEQDAGALLAQLAGEKSAREALESQLSDCRRQLADAASLTAQLEASHRQSIARLERSLDSRHAELAALASERESRVGELEARIADLSAGLGEAERRRQTDAKAIRRLRDRLDTFERANAAAAGAVAAVETSSAHPVAVVEPLPRLLAQLSIDSAKSDEQASSSVFAASDLDQESQLSAAAVLDPHAGCREQTRQLRTELEAVRQRLATVASAATASAAAELQRAQRDLRACRERCQALEAEAARRKQVALARDAEAERRRREEAARLRRELTGRAREAEEELTRHRDRTLRLLAEKDAELRAALTGQGGISVSTRGGSQPQGLSMPLFPPPPPSSPKTASEAEEQLLVDQLRPSAAACASVHAQLEGARVQADVAGLREARRQAEMRLRCLQSELAEQRQLIAELRVQLARCQQPTLESAEYVRNLVYRFLTLADDPGAKRTILSALCTVLNFSESEKHRALQKQLAASSWW